MINVGIFIKDSEGNYNRIELFDDEKISVNSSIQNINDISKVFTDYSQTFTVPASVKNNKIFKHWYENSLDNPFSTLVKSDAYIELDTILFRSGKIQLESCSIENNRPQNYSITFIGVLGSLKDKFAGLMLKDLDSNYYDFTYSATDVKDKVTTTATSADVMFPLISSQRYWTFGSGIENINNASTPIRYNELFPAIRLRAVFDMIDRDSKFNLNFNGAFLSDPRFTNAYLYLKNAELFKPIPTESLITWDTADASTPGFIMNLADDSFTGDGLSYPAFVSATLKITVSGSGVVYNIHVYKNGAQIFKQILTSTNSNVDVNIVGGSGTINSTDIYTVKISSLIAITFDARIEFRLNFGMSSSNSYADKSPQTYSNNNLPIKNYFPEIKIEDFFSGILKMFNLTCYSEDGINFTVEQLESYYNNGTIRDITKYVKSDNINLTRVKTFKKINFEYEKSESLVNIGFLSANGVEYGSLLYNTNNDGEEYGIKLPFEDLNFNNLQDKLQVGFALKSDLQKYIPKPVILYDYNPT
ncbi:MAG: hypothetical protein H7239_10170, partial [Flavobacterium sp.]|nr:hypothetical protein [Flavobacterium sp.]